MPRREWDDARAAKVIALPVVAKNETECAVVFSLIIVHVRAEPLKFDETAKAFFRCEDQKKRC